MLAHWSLKGVDIAFAFPPPNIKVLYDQMEEVPSEDSVDR